MNIMLLSGSDNLRVERPKSRSLCSPFSDRGSKDWNLAASHLRRFLEQGDNPVNRYDSSEHWDEVREDDWFVALLEQKYDAKAREFYNGKGPGTYELDNVAREEQRAPVGGNLFYAYYGFRLSIRDGTMTVREHYFRNTPDTDGAMIDCCFKYSVTADFQINDTYRFPWGIIRMMSSRAYRAAYYLEEHENYKAFKVVTKQRDTFRFDVCKTIGPSRDLPHYESDDFEPHF